MKTTLEIYVKNGKKWELSREWSTDDTAKIYKSLAEDLTNKFLMKCTYITRITQNCIYGDCNMREITVYFTGGLKRVYTVPAC